MCSVVLLASALLLRHSFCAHPVRLDAALAAEAVSLHKVEAADRVVHRVRLPAKT